ncbi:MAG: hypothetical protein ACI9RG_000549 [Sulfurimonas sp.]
MNKRRVTIKEHPEYFAANAQRLAIFWTIVTLPLSGVAIYRGSYGAYMWTCRNPLIVTDAVASYFPATAPTPSLAGAAGFGTSKIYDITE